MSFTLHLQTCNFGRTMRQCRNPFTGESFEVPIDDGLTVAEREAVRKLLKEHGAGKPDPDTYCRIVFADGSWADIAIGTLDSDERCGAFEVECSSITPLVALFVLELARRANMSIGSSIDPDVTALVNPPTEQIATRWPMLQVVSGVDDFIAWLNANIQRGTIV